MGEGWLKFCKTQRTFAQATLFLTLAWSKLNVSGTSFEPFQIFLIHLSLIPAITAIPPDKSLAYATSGAALLMLYLRTMHV